MTQVVQARCPGCKQPLRIPAEWLSQFMRCRHCGMISHVPPPAPSPSAGPHSPASAQGASAQRPAPAASVYRQPAAPATPLASSPFADLDLPPEESACPSPRRRRSRQRGRGSWWMAPVLAVAVLGVAGIVTAASWSFLKPLLLPAASTAVASADGGKHQGEEDGGSQAGHLPPSPFKGRPTTAKRPPTNKKPGARTGPNSGTPKPASVSGKVMPRRALIVSIHDYLYATPIHDGVMGMPSSVTINSLQEALAHTALQVPLPQVAYLSDNAAKGQARTPLKEVIEKTITRFLDASREQDRVLIMFIGHSVEADNKVFLAPIEGEMESPQTLIPLQWLYDRMARCKARQKVLVLDVNRYHPTLGQERPGPGPMGPLLDNACKNPPAGVQVWASCSLKQRSYETDECPEGVFVDALNRVLRHGIPGRIQKPDDLLPLDDLVTRVNAEMERELKPHQLKQVSRLTGKPPADGAGYDPKEAPPPQARLALAPMPAQGGAGNKAIVEKVLGQIGTPPLKPTRDEVTLRYEALPPFAADVLQKYDMDRAAPESKLRAAVHQTRVALWAIAPVKEPAELAPEVSKIRKDLKVNLNVLRDGYRAPAAAGNGEARFKDEVSRDEKSVARIIRVLTDALEMMEADEVKQERKKETKSWQANYDFMLARLREQIAFLYEYQSLLGQIRREFPPRDPAVHSGWRLAASTTPQGDSQGKKLAREAHKLLDKVAKDNAGTPWAVLAKREKLTALGLEWQPSSNQ